MSDLSTTPPRDKNPLSDTRLLAVLCHASALIGVGIILPLIIYIIKKDESEMVAAHAKEALNFHISMTIYAFVCLPLCLIIVGIPLFFAVAIGSFVLAIIGTIKAADDQSYRYPFTIRLI